MVDSFSNLKESQHSFLPSQDPIPMEVHPPILPNFILRTSKDINNPKSHQEPPPPIIIQGEEEWEVSQIMDSKIKRGKLWYLVEWKGFSQEPEGSTWEPTENLKNFLEFFKDLDSLHPDKPGLNSSGALLFMVLGGKRNYQK
ncbi:hypothetical protein O181_003555 [Austropuccinia psidii MF-1]|uniref:Chromo domain-containing protein n=1 Tax=Austropuccinia psidii MF-1 TaxID=1389203 RepID=A0A9Q3GE10_9BASI|nr:hypothetical protein [Austropuccinia psidii MF-1]